MIIKAKKKQFLPASEGQHAAVIYKIVDVGEVETRFGFAAMIRIYFATEETDSNGRHYSASAQVSQSLHRQSKLSKIIGATGLPPAENSRHGYSTWSVSHSNCRAQLPSGELAGICERY